MHKRLHYKRCRQQATEVRLLPTRLVPLSNGVPERPCRTSLRTSSGSVPDRAVRRMCERSGYGLLPGIRQLMRNNAKVRTGCSAGTETDCCRGARHEGVRVRRCDRGTYQHRRGRGVRELCQRHHHYPHDPVIPPAIQLLQQKKPRIRGFLLCRVRRPGLRRSGRGAHVGGQLRGLVKRRASPP